MLEVKVKKSLSEFTLEVSFSVERGRYLVVLGRSGAGKSMLAKLIAGFEKCDEGEILLNGLDITCLPPEKRKISYLPQGNSLFPHMTVKDNLTFPLKVKGKKVDEEKILAISKAFGIEEILNRKPKAISGGEAQRVALARAILSEPEVVILDEPLNSLDFFTKVELLQFLKNLKGKMTFIYITHDPIEAKELADSILVMERGRGEFFESWEEFMEAEGKLPSAVRSFFLPLFR